MDVLVFGKGKIYHEFYSSLFSNCNVDFFDPRLNLVNTKRNYDVIVICSSSLYHYDNMNYILQNDIKYKKIIIEKPLVKSVAEFNFLTENFDMGNLYTLTPFRLSSFYNFMCLHKDEIESLYLDYGILSKWNNETKDVSIYDSCLYDLGPHVLDTIFNAFKFSDYVVIKKYIDFNNFSVQFNNDSISFDVSVSRSSYKTNHIQFLLKNGDVVKFSISNSNYIGSSIDAYSLSTYYPSETSAHNELINILGGNSSKLFSDAIDFKNTISFIEMLNV